jgi:hypothetical protein
MFQLLRFKKGSYVIQFLDWNEWLPAKKDSKHRFLKRFLAQVFLLAMIQHQRQTPTVLHEKTN